MTLSQKVNIIFAIAIIALAAFNIKSCSNASDLSDMLQAQKDSIRTQKNKKGQYESTIAILHGTVADLKKLDASKDSSIKALQNMVDKHTISATVHGTSTSNTIVSYTIVKHDTIFKNDTIEVNPVYSTNFKNNWEDFNIVATKDTFHLDYKLFNKFDYSVRYNKQKWYKARVPEITVTNLNPHTETVELKNFTVKPPKNQKIIVFLGGGMAGALSVIGTKALISQIVK